MKKSLTSSLIITIILTIAATAFMYFVPLPTDSSEPYPDGLTTTSYGFPLVFKTTQSGGIAGNLPAKTTIDSTNLALNIGLIAVVTFALSFGLISLSNRHKS